VREDYIIRIYRRDKKNPTLIVGTVEKVGVEGKRAFENFDELWAILTSPPRKESPEKGQGAGETK
jgi:hypothetical protein